MNGKRQSLHQWTLEKKMSIDEMISPFPVNNNKEKLHQVIIKNS